MRRVIATCQDAIVNVDRYPVSERMRNVRQNGIHRGLRHGRQQQLIVHRIRIEYFPEAWRDNRLDPVLQEAPHRMLSARTAAEVLAADQYPAAAVVRPVEDKIATRFP